jgi:hypothetical protein
MKLARLALAAALLSACLANVSANSTTQGAVEHQPSADYYAVSQPAYVWSDGVASADGTAPAVDKLISKGLPGIIPEDALLQIMDANKADYGFEKVNQFPTRAKWFPRSNSTFNAKSFIHKTRCYLGGAGITVHASTGTGATYKKCVTTFIDMFELSC